MATLLANSTASVAANAATEYGEFFGNLRAGAITAEDSTGVDTDAQPLAENSVF